MAGSFTFRSVVLALVVIGVLISGNNVVVGQPCKGLTGLVTECAVYVLKSGPKTDPSQACCGAIKEADVPCLCQHVTKEMEDMADMEKVVYVAKFCGKPLTPGSKCGRVLISGNNVVVGQPCKGLPGLVTECAVYVLKSAPKADPSAACCGAVKAADVPCICQHVTKEMEDKADMKKVVYVAKFCGKPLTPGSKCGSKK